MILSNHHANQMNSHIDGCELSGDFLVIYADIYPFLDSRIKDSVSAKVKNNSHLNILLKTNGGSPDVLKRIVDFLRDTYERIDFYVMDYAMSAGTMFCMAGDNIYMSNEACLGPIDPQVLIDKKYVPAQAHLRSWKLLTEKRQLSQAEVIMSQKFNPADLELCKQASKFSVQLVTDWLQKYKFTSWNASDAEKKGEAERIAKELDNSKTWKTHSYPLNRKELADLGLRIEGIEGEKFVRMKALGILLDDFRMLYSLNMFIHLKEQ